MTGGGWHGPLARDDLSLWSRDALVDLAVRLQSELEAAQAYARESLRALGNKHKEMAGVELELEDANRELAQWRTGERLATR